jgi:predicted alpha/beta-fold hydrolase
MTPERDFNPPFYLRSATLQSMLASSSLRKRNADKLNAAAQDEILSLDHDVRLMARISRQPHDTGKGMAILIHGWEGSSESAYIISLGKYLFAKGFSVARLNLRDHGPTHHLNPDIFYATMIDESHQAVQRIAELSDDGLVFLAGFSLGGNFALRIGLKCRDNPIPNLGRIVAVSPVLNPAKATVAVDRTWMIRKYFLKKWRRSMQKKQELFPDLYDFRPFLHLGSIKGLTDALLEKYSEFPSTHDYFSRYTITGRALEPLPIPTAIITAADDPIIPVEDFHALTTNDQTRVIIHAHGGHCGFIENLHLSAWHEPMMAELFSQAMP